MRGKVAKYLRRRVRQETVGRPWLGYNLHTRMRKVLSRGKIIEIPRACISLQSGCGRDLYQTVKRKYHADKRRVRAA